jgi:hypothetical protein
MPYVKLLAPNIPIKFDLAQQDFMVLCRKSALSSPRHCMAMENCVAVWNLLVLRENAGKTRLFLNERQLKPMIIWNWYKYLR